MPEHEICSMSLDDLQRQGLGVVFRSEVLNGKLLELVPEDGSRATEAGAIKLSVREARILVEGQPSRDELRSLMRARHVFQASLF